MKKFGNSGKVTVRVQHTRAGRAFKTETFTIFGHSFEAVNTTVESALAAQFGSSEEETEDEEEVEEEEEEKAPAPAPRRRRVRS